MRNNKNVKKVTILFSVVFAFTSILISCSSQTDTKADSKTETNQADKKEQESENLSQAELDYFTKYFSDVDNNGFILCNFQSPIDIDLHTVLYAGAGCDKNMKSVSSTERNAYLKAVGQDQVYLDLHRITTKQINDLLQKKVEITLTQVKKQLSWTYLKEYDTYYLEQGDTNYCLIKCVSGYKTSDGLYVLQCENPNKDNVQITNSCEVTLKKVGDSYIFESNVIKDGAGLAK